MDKKTITYIWEMHFKTKILEDAKRYQKIVFGSWLGMFAVREWYIGYFLNFVVFSKIHVNVRKWHICLPDSNAIVNTIHGSEKCNFRTLTLVFEKITKVQRTSEISFSYGKHAQSTTENNFLISFRIFENFRFKVHFSDVSDRFFFVHPLYIY